MSERDSQLTTIYIGNTRPVSNDDLRSYCSKFGLVRDCSRRLRSAEQRSLVDFTFVRFLHLQSASSFLSTPSHRLTDAELVLEVRPFSEILHDAVPLHVDRKICLIDVPQHISVVDVRKYLRTFGDILQAKVETTANEQRCIYVEFESTAARNKLLKGKVRQHRVRDHLLRIVPLLRPTDVDLHTTKDEK